MGETLYRKCGTCDGDGRIREWEQGPNAWHTSLCPEPRCVRGFVPVAVPERGELREYWAKLIHPWIYGTALAWDETGNPEKVRCRDAASAILADIGARPLILPNGVEALLARALGDRLAVRFRAHDCTVYCSVQSYGSDTDPAWRWYDGKGDSPASALAAALKQAEGVNGG